MTDNPNFESNNKAEMDEPTPAPSTRDERDTAENISEKQDGVTASSTEKVEPEYLTGVRLGLVMFTIFVSTILVSLEIGIIATAIPGITNDFRRLDDVGWYGSATFILAASASPLWGKLYKYINVKWIYLSAVGIFLVGSIVAAAAPNSVAVIVGRAFQGWGASGVLGGTLIVINYVAPPRNHPISIGLWMAQSSAVHSQAGSRGDGVFGSTYLLAVLLWSCCCCFFAYRSTSSRFLPHGRRLSLTSISQASAYYSSLSCASRSRFNGAVRQRLGTTAL
jgi:hypothetical protein